MALRRHAIATAQPAASNGCKLQKETSMKPSFTRRALAVVLAMFATGGALAQGAASYPSQPLRIIVPYPAGGGTDTLARIIATKLQESWKQTVVVENKPGASGTIGNDMVAKSPRD